MFIEVWTTCEKMAMMPGNGVDAWNKVAMMPKSLKIGKDAYSQFAMSAIVLATPSGS